MVFVKICYAISMRALSISSCSIESIQKMYANEKKILPQSLQNEIKR